MQKHPEPPAGKPDRTSPRENDSGSDMQALFERAVALEASDLIITAGAPPSVRVDGEIQPLMKTPLAPATAKRLIWSLVSDYQKMKLEEQRELDFAIEMNESYRFRANIYFQKGCVAGSFRLIPQDIPPLQSLGLPKRIDDLILRTNGLILVTGPTGSGKSTTQASMIDVINSTRKCHIVTIEDPIEFVHHNKNSIVDQREVYSDTLSFANALKYVLRQNPDVILVGEMRDMETIAAALTAAETGHLVIATLHTNDAIQSIDRILDVFPPHRIAQIRVQLAFTLLAVVAQQLIPHVSGKGRILATEVLIVNQAVSSQIREGKLHQTRTAMETGRRHGMITMDHRLKDLYEKRQIRYKDVVQRVSTPTFLQKINVAAQDAALLKSPAESRDAP